MGDHPFEFGPVHQIQEPGSGTDNRVFWITARCKCIWRRVDNDIKGRHRQTGGNTEIFSHRIEIKISFFIGFYRSGCHQDQFITIKIASDRGEDGNKKTQEKITPGRIEIFTQ